MKRDIVLLNDTSKNKTGPSINPWGTPHVMLADLKSWMETIHVIYVYLIAVFVSGYLCGLVVGSLAELPPPVDRWREHWWDPCDMCVFVFVQHK